MTNPFLHAILPHMNKVDYGKLLTEQSNPRTRKIDTLSIEKILDLINKEDQTVPQKVAKEKKKIAQGVKLIVASLKKGGRVFFAGAGTSGRLGVLEAAECPPTFNTPPELIQAFMAGGKEAVFQSQEGAEDRLDIGFSTFSKNLRANDIVIGVAASGVTPYVQGALMAAKKKKLKTILVTCSQSQALKKWADCLIAVKTGPEVISGSTRLKAGTATKLVLNMLTVTSMVQIGKVYQNWMVDLQPKSKKLYARALRLIQHLGQVAEKDALRYLYAADKQVKTAIVMGRTGWSKEKAAAELRKHRGFLFKALGGR